MALQSTVEVKQGATAINVNWDVCPHIGLRLQNMGISVWTFIDAGSSADAIRLSQCRVTATIAGTRTVGGPLTAVAFGAWTKISAQLSAAELATGLSLECQLWRGTEDWQGNLFVDDLVVQ